MAFQSFIRIFKYKLKQIQMKNLHLIPTDKPSRLCLSNNSILTIIEEANYTFSHIQSVHIYITSDEEIKVGDWVIKVSTLYKGGGSVEKYSFIDKLFEDITFKKIILTTDTDLIKDGVQAIDDEFLEWFVKNPSCEEVEVGYGWIRLTETDNEGYWVSIPDNQYEMTQEEPKQETLEEREPYWDLIDKKAEQNNRIDLDAYANGVQDGVKWQKERSYSEEDMFKFSQWISHEDWVYLPSKDYWVNEEQEELEQKLSSKEILNMWFEQFKKHKGGEQ